MAQTKKKGGGFDAIFMFLIFGIFALTSMVLLVLGARVYNSVIQSTRSTSKLRSSLTYVTNKVRGGDAEGAIIITQEGDLEILNIPMEIEGLKFRTLIYFKDGAIMEQLLLDGIQFEHKLSEPVLKVDGFKMEQDGNLLTFTVTDEGEKEVSASVALKSRPKGE